MIFKQENLIIIKVIENSECWKLSHLAKCAMDEGLEGRCSLPSDAHSYEQAEVDVTVIRGELKQIEI